MSQVTGPLAGRRILLVEDEYVIVEVVETWLTRAGAIVVGPVPSVEQALGLLESEADALDGAVLDVNLGPDQTAYPIADRLDELSVPYLFTTGEVGITGNPKHQKRPHLSKPISRSELLRAVETLLATHPSRDS
jgi:CheY-like chemotaxis protein